MRRALTIFTYWQAVLLFLLTRTTSLLRELKYLHANSFKHNTILQYKNNLNRKICKVQKDLRKVWDLEFKEPEIVLYKCNYYLTFNLKLTNPSFMISKLSYHISFSPKGALCTYQFACTFHIDQSCSFCITRCDYRDHFGRYQNESYFCKLQRLLSYHNNSQIGRTHVYLISICEFKQFLDLKVAVRIGKILLETIVLTLFYQILCSFSNQNENRMFFPLHPNIMLPQKWTCLAK